MFDVLSSNFKGRVGDVCKRRFLIQDNCIDNKEHVVSYQTLL